jgi:hypothetical protein
VQRNSLANQQIQGIIKALNDIIKILGGRNNAEILRRERQRRYLESQRRRRKEQELEQYSRGPRVELPKKITGPVLSVLDKIWNFIKAVFFGKVLIKLIDWFSDKKNKTKVDSIVRFLKDNWPKLIALYLVFGTSLGKFARGLTTLLISGTRRLVAAVAELLAATGLKSFKGFARFVGGPKGRLIGGLIGAGVAVAGTLAISKTLEGNKEEDKKKPESKPTTPKPTPSKPISVQGRSGGGLAQLKNIFGFLGGSVVHTPGQVEGEHGIDKVPAMLTHGEFIMSAPAVNKIGVGNLEYLNSTYGGPTATNRPRMVSGNFFAAGGGYVGDPSKSFTQSSRTESGLNNLLQELEHEYKLQSVLGYGNDLPKLKGPSIPKPPSPKISLLPYERGGAIVPYQKPGALVKPESPVTRISTNMNVPSEFENALKGSKKISRGIKGLSIIGGILSSLMFINDTINLIKKQQYKDATRSAISNALGIAAFDAVAGLSGATAGLEEFASAGTATPAAVATIGAGMVGATTASAMAERSSDKLLSHLGLADKKGGKRIVGGGILGGYGLKKQSFKDMPATQLMTDDKGKAFVGHKAKLGDKVVYKKGKSLDESYNIFDRIGKFFNPEGYKKAEQTAQKREQDIAAQRSIGSLKSRGASQLTIDRRSQQIRNQIGPPSSKKVNVIHTNGDSRSRMPAFPKRGRPELPNMPTSNSSHHNTRKILGIF